MGGARSTYGREEKRIQGFDGYARRKECRWEYIIKEDLKKAEWVCLYWIDLALQSGKLWPVVETDMKLRSP